MAQKGLNNSELTYAYLYALPKVKNVVLRNCYGIVTRL